MAAPTVTTAPTVAADPIAKGAPHGGQIAQVAVTEQADAAITLDHIGGVRLWPALDGSRPPVPLALVAPRQLALVHAGRDLLVAVLDEAGSVDLMRLGRDGSVRTRVQVPADVAHEQVLALGDGMLLRRADHAVEWLAADGASRGRLVVEPGRRVQAIAARRDRAVAIVSDGKQHELRWLHTLDRRLTWGPSRVLPDAVKDDLIALSPSHRRVALVDAEAQVAVYELGLAPVRIAAPVRVAHDVRDLGFIDEDNLAIMSRALQWQAMPPSRPPGDPWAVTASMPTPGTMAFTEGGAVGDGVAVTGFGAALALSGKDGVRYLGYEQHGVGQIEVVGELLSSTTHGSRVLWLDDTLAVARHIELRSDQSQPWVNTTPIGEHHVVTQKMVESKYSVELVDIDRPERRVSLGTYRNTERIEYASDVGVLAIGDQGTVQRFALDLASMTATKLPPLRRTGSLTRARMLDPARSGGIAAITLGWAHEADDAYTLTLYRDDGTRERIRPFTATLVAIAADATLYTYTANEIQVRRGTQQLARIPAEGIESPVAVAATGTRFAMRARNDVVMIDERGAVLWRKPVWGAAQLVFTADGRHLAVRGVGGLLLLATETGERAALACGWTFGVMTTPPTSNIIGVAPICEDPTL